MEDHRRNGWFLIGGVPVTAGVTLLVGWVIAVQSHEKVGRPALWSWPSYLAVALAAVGVLLIFAVMNEWWLFSFHSHQHTFENLGPGGGRGSIDGTGYGYGGSASEHLPSDGSITAGRDITAGQDIRTPGEIKAGGSIEAGKAPGASADASAARSHSASGSGTGSKERSTSASSGGVPDFSAELVRFNLIDRDYNDTDAESWIPRIDQWIEDIRIKLEEWNPRQAERFMATSIADAAQGHISRFVGRPDVAKDPNLRRLHVYREHLRQIVDH
jgi:hypothetical protein